MSTVPNSFNQSPACTENAEKMEPGRFLTPTAVCGWLGFAILLFLVQALPYLSHRWVTDESWYAGPAYSIARGNGVADPAIGPNDIENHFDARPPGTAMVIAAAFRLFGTGQIQARLGSIVAGLGIIILTYCLARDFIGEQGALIAASLVGTDNLIVLTSRSARPEALTTMAVLASFLAMKQYAGKGRIVWPLLCGLLMGLGTMFHITLLGYIVSFGILAIVLDRTRDGFPLRGAISYTTGYALGLLPFTIWILTAPMGRAGFREEYLNRAGGTTLWSRFFEEGHRYSNLLGLNMLHGLESIPVRLPIPLFVLTSSFLLFRMRRKWFYLELVLLAPSILWFVYTVNKSSRYLALLAPVFAMVIGAAVAATIPNRKLHRSVLVFSCLVVAAQIFANLVLLLNARNANYNTVAAELRNLIPAGQTAYGTITFWLALHDHSYISYERTDPHMAANEFHARYFITGDRVMDNGLPGDEAFYRKLNLSMEEIAARSTLVGHFRDPYYGDLKVYEMHGP